MTARISGLYLEDLAVDSQWRSRAECGGTGDVMWPEAAGSLQARVRALVATYCRVCPVVAECALAGRDEPYGIWGGVYRRKGRAAFDREVVPS